jgi:hypothetical protein
MKPETDYVYDVFVSYTRDHPVGTWVEDRFLKDFEGFLQDRLGRKATVFYDRRAIRAGEDWQQELERGLKLSRVLVAVCSARYFQDSPYCQMEWYTFGDRGLKGKKVHRPRVPVRYSDGKSFPPDAKAVQWVDFSNANYIVEAFYRTDKRAVDYEDKVRELAEAVVEAIDRAPKYDPGFSIARPAQRPERPIRQPRL